MNQSRKNASTFLQSPTSVFRLELTQQLSGELTRKCYADIVKFVPKSAIKTFQIIPFKFIMVWFSLKNLLLPEATIIQICHTDYCVQIGLINLIFKYKIIN